MPRTNRAKVAPSVIGRLVGPYASAPRLSRNLGRYRTAGNTLPFAWTMPYLPGNAYKPKKGTDQAGNIVEQPQNAVFQKADALYQTFTEPQRRQWKAAVKAPHMSGYDLWMKESMTLMMSGQPPNLIPSHSGGWSRRNLTPGTDLIFPDCGFNPCLKSLRVKWTIVSLGPPAIDAYALDWTTTFPYNDHDHWRDKIGIAYACNPSNPQPWNYRFLWAGNSLWYTAIQGYGTPSYFQGIYYEWLSPHNYAPTFWAATPLQPWTWTRPNAWPWEAPPAHSYAALDAYWRPKLIY
jgi:hypothetical protein